MGQRQRIRAARRRRQQDNDEPTSVLRGRVIASPAAVARLLRRVKDEPDASALRSLAARQLMALQAARGNQEVQRLVERAESHGDHEPETRMAETSTLHRDLTTETTASVMRSPGPNKSKWGGAIVSAADTRATDPVGKAYDYGKHRYDWFYSPNASLAGWRSKHLKWERNADGSKPKVPAGEGVVHWGPSPTCNVYVYDVLHAAGAKPPLLSNKHYYDAGHTYSRAGGLKSYLSRVKATKHVLPGDICCDGVHMEVVMTKPDKGGNFTGLGAHSDGAYPKSRNAKGYRFFRVN